MSAVLRLPFNNGKPNNIFLIYDFKQIKDVILMVMYVDKLNSWQKVFVSYKDGAWNTHTLTRYMDAQTYKHVCNKLQLIFPTGLTANEKALDLEQTMQNEATLMLGLCS